MKRIICFLLFLISIGGIALAQNTPPRYLPFQGKLYENGQPLTGQKTFSFSINDGGVNWTETHPNVTINQGLYAVTLGSITPLPTNVFRSQGMHELTIQVEGNPLDIVTIYAPVENDPTVREDVKDGVSWSEIQNLPAGIDTDVTNELQVLSISGDTIYISDGNFIVLPGNDLLNSNTFQVGQYDTITQPDVGQLFGNVLYTNNSVWQSFKPSVSGRIRAIEVDFNNLDPQGQIRLNIRPGEGTNQQSISGQIFNASNFPTGPAPSFKNFQLNDPVEVTVGNTYTFELVKEGGNNQNLTFRTDGTANTYLNGRSSIDPSTDLKFIIHMEIVTEPNFVVQPEGGIEAPNGRIKDKTGYVAFPGEIRMFAGPKEHIPEGWLLCDGSLLDKNEYVDLFNAIGNAWGDGDGDSQRFRLPDLRGAFVRGVDHNAGKDPDANSRGSEYSGGNEGNMVGSFQENELKAHEHEVVVAGHDAIYGVPVTVGLSPGGYLAPPVGHKIQMGYDLGGSISQNIKAKAFGGTESRPFNAYVNYIIKY